MNISRLRALRGPNLWSRHTAISALVECTPQECAISAIEGFEARLRERFPLIGAMRQIGHVGDISLAHAFAHAALGLQAQAGCAVAFCRTVPTVDTGIYQIVVEYSEEAVGLRALELAEALIEAALADTSFDLGAALAELKELDEDIRLGPSTGAIVNAAVARGIPYRRLTDGSLVQFGWGSRQRRIQAAESDRSSAISEMIAQDKDLTKRLLAAVGVPVPAGRVTHTFEEACAAMDELGGAVTAKPLDGNQGKGVTVNIVSHDHLAIAFAAAQTFCDSVIVERFIPGHDFRALVIGGRLIAAARRDPPHVIGDGEKTVRELVAAINEDPRRGDGHATSLSKIRIDEIAVARLAIQGYTPESVLAKGARAVLRNNANLSTGGTATDVTDDVHPDWSARVIEAAGMIGLDICGVDVVCETVQRSLEAQGGGIVEVNAAPGLRMHLSPSYGKGRAVGEAVIASMFADGDDARIPLVAVTGTNGKTTTVRLIAHMLANGGQRVGMTCTDGVYVNGRQLDTGDCSGPKSARSVLMHPDVDAAVLETARGGLLREGLAFDRCAVAVVTNVGVGDHLGLNYITTVDELAVLKRVIVQNVADRGFAVLNAADPIVARMAEHCSGQVIFFALDPSVGPLAAHWAQGRRVVTVVDGAIVAIEGGELARIPLAKIPLTMGGRIPFQIDNAMASVAAAWALGVDWQTIARSLGTFSSTVAMAPGRFNVLDYRGATVVADYGHNPDAMVALVAAVGKLPAKRRTVVISGAGDRRDEDIVQQTVLLRQAFDRVVLYEDQCQRGRSDGEVIALLRQGLQGTGLVREVQEIRGEFAAIDAALAGLEPGDLCLILIDQIEEALAYLERRIAES